MLGFCNPANASGSTSNLSQGLQDIELQAGRVIVFTSKQDPTITITVGVTSVGEQYYLQFVQGGQAFDPIIPSNLQTQFKDRIWYSSTLEGNIAKYWLQYDTALWSAEIR